MAKLIATCPRCERERPIVYDDTPDQAAAARRLAARPCAICARADQGKARPPLTVRAAVQRAAREAPASAPPASAPSARMAAGAAGPRECSPSVVGRLTQLTEEVAKFLASPKCPHARLRLAIVLTREAGGEVSEWRKKLDALAR